LSQAELLDALRTIIAENCPPTIPAIDDPDRPLAEYGIDSLDLASILLAFEERFGLKVPDSDIDRLRTLNNLAAYLVEKGVGQFS
jgi:acyl carrier protein